MFPQPARNDSRVQSQEKPTDEHHQNSPNTNRKGVERQNKLSGGRIQALHPGGLGSVPCPNVPPNLLGAIWNTWPGVAPRAPKPNRKQIKELVVSLPGQAMWGERGGMRVWQIRRDQAQCDWWCGRRGWCSDIVCLKH